MICYRKDKGTLDLRNLQKEKGQLWAHDSNQGKAEKLRRSQKSWQVTKRAKCNLNSQAQVRAKCNLDSQAQGLRGQGLRQAQSPGGNGSSSGPGPCFNVMTPLLSAMIIYSWFLYVFCSNPEIRHFFQKPRLLLMGNGASEPHPELDMMSVSRHLERTELWCLHRNMSTSGVHVDTHTSDPTMEIHA